MAVAVAVAEVTVAVAVEAAIVGVALGVVAVIVAVVAGAMPAVGLPLGMAPGDTEGTASTVDVEVAVMVGVAVSGPALVVGEGPRISGLSDAAVPTPAEAISKQSSGTTMREKTREPSWLFIWDLLDVTESVKCA
ncbi:MAG TPA: hypothetical protein VHS06_02590 [Chloroflexota bacterium]|nr:hypothetical protein [Chloroflexota bacterium]